MATELVNPTNTATNPAVAADTLRSRQNLIKDSYEFNLEKRWMGIVL